MLQNHHSSAIKPQRAVILGASGFVASNLARHFNEQQINHRVIGSKEIDLLKPQCVFELQSAIHDGDALVITSGLTPDKGRDIGTFMKNLKMAENLASFIECASLSQVIYISSDSVYNGDVLPIRESSTRQPRDLYSLMHIAREQIMKFATAKQKTPLCIFCPCAIYGAGDTHNSYGPNRFFRTALSERKITLFGNGEEVRDHVFIEDVVQLLNLCLQHRSEGIINAVSGTTVTFHELASKISDLCNQDVRVEHQARESQVAHREFDVSERTKAFPSFIPTPLDDGLAKTFLELNTIPKN
jgi:nucleoside-diphosphate-sugar epimerase